MTTLTTVPVADIKPIANLNARQKFTDKELEPLKLSIERKGILVPLVVQKNGKGYQLVAGHRRLRVAQLLKLDQVPVTVRDAGDELEVAAIENMQREQLTPLEEGRAVKALIDSGYTEKGAAEALSISETKVRERVALVGAPREVQDAAAAWAKPKQLKVLLSMAEASPALAAAVAKYLADPAGDVPSWQAEDLHYLRQELTDEPIQLLEQVLDGEREKLGLWRARNYDPKKIPGVDEALATEAAEKLKGEYWPYRVELTADEAIEHARSLNALWEDHSQTVAVIIGNDAVAEVARAQIERDLANHKPDAGGKKTTTKGEATSAEEKEREKKRKHREAVYEAQIAARGLNLELGGNLVTKLASRKFDKSSAELLAYLILSDGNGGMHDLAHAGLRLVFADWQTDATKTLKSGKRGKTKIVYLDRAEAEKKAWAWFDQAKTAEQILGRLLVVLVAGQYALAEALPESQQWETRARRPINKSFPGARDKRALQALEKIAKPVLSAAYTKFVNAQKKARKR